MFYCLPSISLVPDVACISRLPILNVAAVFSNIYLMHCSLSDQYSVCILIWQVFYKRQKLLTRHEHMGSSPDLCGVVLLIFLVFCFVLFVLFVLVLCLVCQMLPVFLVFPFLIAPSVFLTYIINENNST